MGDGTGAESVPMAVGGASDAGRITFGGVAAFEILLGRSIGVAKVKIKINATMARYGRANFLILMNSPCFLMTVELDYC